MNSSLPSYDLQRLFHNIHTPPTTKVSILTPALTISSDYQESGGESLITDETVFSDASSLNKPNSSSSNNSSIMTDSLHAVVWEEAEEQ